MKRILAIPLAGLGMLSIGFAQTLEEYLRLRKQHGVTSPIDVARLESLTAAKVVELRGLVKGVVSTEDGSLVTLHSGGVDIAFDATNAPGWLLVSDVAARVLIRYDRSLGRSRAAQFLGAAMEYQIAPHDAKPKPAPAAAPKPARAQSQPVSRASKGRPAPLAGSIPGGSAPKKDWQLPASDALPYYAAYIKKQNKRLSDAEATRIANGVIGFSIQYEVDARLIMAMVLVESGFDPTTTSRAGAMGLGQLMPGTAKGMGVANAYDSIENLYGTVRLVRGHLDKYGKQTGGDPYRSLVLALAAYNAGSGAVRKHGGVPPYRETQNYIKKVTAAYRRLTGQG